MAIVLNTHRFTTTPGRRIGLTGYRTAFPQAELSAPKFYTPFYYFESTPDIASRPVTYTSLLYRDRGGGAYFGTGLDGSVTYSATTDIGGYPNKDAEVLVYNFKDLTIDSSVVVSLLGRRRAVIVYVSGNCNIQGTLQNNKGASATPTQSINITHRYPLVSGSEIPHNFYLSYPASIPLVGGAGAPGQTGVGVGGTAGSSGGLGGGGSGGRFFSGTSGAGAAGTSFSGGSGGAGCCAATGGSAAGNGGTGGAGAATGTGGAGGGAGNPGGAGATSGGGQTANPGSDGTGGVLLLVVGGTLTIGVSAFLKANGSAGGNTNSPANGSGAGGGSGGGRVVAIYGGVLSNSGTIQASGGAAGDATGAQPFDGGGGGAGTTTIQQIYS